MVALAWLLAVEWFAGALLDGQADTDQGGHAGLLMLLRRSPPWVQHVGVGAGSRDQWKVVVFEGGTVWHLPCGHQRLSRA
jgi:hypothetical protein